MRPIEKILSSIIMNFSFPKAISNIEEEILNNIINCNEFIDIGLIILYDNVKHTFYLPERGICSKNEKFNYNDSRDQINICLKEKLFKDEKREVVLSNNCGLVRYVEKMYLENYKNKCFLIIPDLNNFTDDIIKQYYKEVNYFGSNNLKINTEIIFPISINYEELNLEQKEILHGIVIFDLINNIEDISISDITLLSKIISLIVNTNINELADKAFLKLINEFSKFDHLYHDQNKSGTETCNSNLEKNRIEPSDHFTLSNSEDCIFNALKSFYFQNITQEEKFLDTELEYKNLIDINERSHVMTKSPPHCDLKFASFWIYNNLEDGSDYLIRNKSFIFSDVDYNDINIIDSRKINNIQHIFYTYINELEDNINSGKPYAELLKVYKLESIKNQFYDWKNFSSRDGHSLSECDFLVLLPIMPHFTEKVSAERFKSVSVSLLVLFIDENTYTYYINQTFLELMAHSIYENFQLAIHRIRRTIRSKILENVKDLFIGNTFYKNASKIITSNIGIEDCLIYLINDNRDNLKLVSDIGFEFPEDLSLINSNLQFKNRVPNEIYNYLKEKTISETNEDFFIFPSGNTFSNKTINELKKIKFENADKSVDSLLILPIKFSNNLTAGYLILINNLTKIIPFGNQQRRTRSYFSKEEIEIGQIAAQVIGKYTEIISHAYKTQATLSKLQHEIPALSSIIVQNARDLYEDTEKLIFNKNHFLNVFDEIEGEALLLNVFAEYAHIENIDEYLIKQPRDEQNLIYHLKSIQKVFKKDSLLNGVDLRLLFIDESKKQNTIIVNKLFPLAIFNIIRNAIQYSYFGTTIWIKVIPHGGYMEIIVENIGIPINDGDIKRILDELHYRSIEARRKQITGTGYGLKLANKIVKFDKGHIDISIKRNFLNRNIFALSCLNKILNDYKTVNDKVTFLSNNLFDKTNDSILLLMQSIALTGSELRKISYLFKDSDEDNYYNYKISYLEGVKMVKAYIDRRMQYGESINDIIMKDINLPMTLVKFIIKIPKESLEIN